MEAKPDVVIIGGGLAGLDRCYSFVQIWIESYFD